MYPEFNETPIKEGIDLRTTCWDLIDPIYKFSYD